MAFVGSSFIGDRLYPCRSVSLLRVPKVCGPIRVPSMVAAEPVKKELTLSDRASYLRGFIRAHKSIFHAGDDFKSNQVALFRKNDTGRTFVPAMELETNAHVLPGRDIAKYILDEKDRLVNDAFEVVLKEAPGLRGNEPVEEIIHYDLMYILRVVSYAAASQTTDFVHKNNIGIMKMLHDEVDIKAKAFNEGIKSMSTAISAQFEGSDLASSTTTCFDVVLKSMSENE